MDGPGVELVLIAPELLAHDVGNTIKIARQGVEMPLRDLQSVDSRDNRFRIAKKGDHQREDPAAFPSSCCESWCG